MKLTIVEGTTAKKALQLLDDGAAVNANGLNAPALVLIDKLGQQVATSNATEWIEASEGTFYVLLASLALSPRRGPYRARFELTDAEGRVAYYPDDQDGDTWTIVPR